MPKSKEFYKAFRGESGGKKKKKKRVVDTYESGKGFKKISKYIIPL